MTPRTAAQLFPRPRRVGSAGTGPLPPQGFRLVVDEAGASRIEAADPAGAFYAERALAALGPTPAPVVIEDWPDFAVRGVMLDVSRDKVPTMATLRGMIERLASLRINQLQLYMEHTFAYDGHEEVWEHASPFTAEEIRELDAFCAERFIELVANQNCLGHMERWLKFDRYRPLAIAPDGWVDARGRNRAPTTLDPSKPGSLELVRDLLAQLLPNATSRRVHVGLDEPWELSDDRFEEYVSYIDRLRAAPELDGRDMLIWGDIVARHPERAEGLPAGVTVCEWGYEADHPFDERCTTLERAGLPFWVCPGTSSWNTVVGRWTNMRENCARAAEAGIAHGASGYLVTDWGDNGHVQYLPFSAPGFAFAAAVSWCAETNRDVDLAAEVAALFVDGTTSIGTVLQLLGDVHRAVGPQLPNTSVLALPWLMPHVRVGEGYTAGINGDQLDEVRTVVGRAVGLLDGADMQRADAALVDAEIRNGAEMIDLFATDMRARLDAGSIEGVSTAVRSELANRIDRIIASHRELWLARNRIGGLDDSCARLERLAAVYRGK